MKGKGIREGATVEGAGIEDLAPTILYAMGSPIPRDMDGRPLTEVFSEEYRTQVPVSYGEEESSRELGETGYSEEAEEEIKERLKGLGYLG
jgi:arylsulfatase A-like enzyme